MQILPRPRSILVVGRLVSNPPRFFRRRRPPALARRDAPLMASASAHPNLDRLSHMDYLSRSIYKPWSLIPFACGTTKCKDIDNLRTKVTNELIECDPTVDDIYFPSIRRDSSHRDGAIYKNKGVQFDLSEDLGGDIADRNETRLEPLTFSKFTKRCLPDVANCTYDYPREMFQFFSVRLSKSPISNGSTQLYGYIAARDDRDGMLNFVVNYSRDDPIIVEQGSFIEMTGPKRCITIDYGVLIEFDIRIKNGVQEDDDLQLIDGAMLCTLHRNRSLKPVKNRITGSSGAVDISLAIVERAVEATIEVIISQVLSGLNLSISSFVDINDDYEEIQVDINDDYEEIQLFHGKIHHSGPLRRFVLAVPVDTVMFLKFSVHGCASRQIKFQANIAGCASRRIKLKQATISVKVTWYTV